MNYFKTYKSSNSTYSILSGNKENLDIASSFAFVDLYLNVIINLFYKIYYLNDLEIKIFTF